MGDASIRASDMENRGLGLYTFPRVRYREASAGAATGETSRGHGNRARRRDGGSLRSGGNATIVALQAFFAVRLVAEICFDSVRSSFGIIDGRRALLDGTAEGDCPTWLDNG